MFSGIYLHFNPKWVAISTTLSFSAKLLVGCIGSAGRVGEAVSRPDQAGEACEAPLTGSRYGFAYSTGVRSCFKDTLNDKVVLELGR